MCASFSIIYIIMKHNFEKSHHVQPGTELPKNEQKLDYNSERAKEATVTTIPSYQEAF